MRRFVSANAISTHPYNRVDYTMLPLTNGSDAFAQAAAIFFVQNWMTSALPRMLTVWQNWQDSSEEEKNDYLSYLNTAFFSKDGLLIDEPEKGYTGPIAAFTETLLRWLRQSFGSSCLLVEPPTCQPPGDGKIDFVEITGCPGDYASFSVTLWEVKSSDHQAHKQNSKIYSQLDDYPMRFYPIANCMATSYSGQDIAMKRFLRDMAMLARNRHRQVRYGVLIAYDPNVKQNGSLASNLHRHPPGYALTTAASCHSLAVLIIPNFKQLRLDVWRSLHLV